MIIISQNRTEVFNFNGIYRLFIDKWFEENSSKELGCFYIRAEKNNGDVFCNILGEYKTEERAKEVLREIVNLFGIRKIENKSYEESDLIMKFKKQAIYEMPKE